jgi:hypothetical protein
MNKKPNLRKLALRTETLRALDRAALSEINGAYPQSVLIMQCFNTKSCPDTKVQCPMDTVQATCTISNIVC